MLLLPIQLFWTMPDKKLLNKIQIIFKLAKMKLVTNLKIPPRIHKVALCAGLATLQLVFLTLLDYPVKAVMLAVQVKTWIRAKIPSLISAHQCGDKTNSFQSRCLKMDNLKALGAVTQGVQIHQAQWSLVSLLSRDNKCLKNSWLRNKLLALRTPLKPK